MSAPEWILAAIALLVGGPAAVRIEASKVRLGNASAAALVAAWVFAQGTFYLFGWEFGAAGMLAIDAAVITVILAKTIVRCGPKVYDSPLHQLRCIVTDLTVWDRGIVALFVLGAWPVYISTLDAFYQWWALLVIAAVQFLLAGGEALLAKRTRRRIEAPELPDPPSMYLQALPVAMAPGIPSPCAAYRLARARGHD